MRLFSIYWLHITIRQEFKMDIEEIDAEIKKLQQLKTVIESEQLPRADSNGLFWYIAEGDVLSAKDNGGEVIKTLIDDGNYFLTKVAAIQVMRNQRFRNDVHLYLRKLNLGMPFKASNDYRCFVISGGGCCRLTVSDESLGFEFKAIRQEHIEKVIKKFGSHSFDDYFKGRF